MTEQKGVESGQICVMSLMNDYKVSDRRDCWTFIEFYCFIQNWAADSIPSTLKLIKQKKSTSLCSS
jgi:hypothetical protein